jgi:hypothetical protein
MDKNDILSNLKNTIADLDNMLPSGEQAKGVGSSSSAAKPPEPNDNAAETVNSAENKKTPLKPPSKKLGNRNALCHGIYSNELTLPWESAADLDKLHAAFKKEWKPCDPTEEFAVLELANYTWIGMRAAKAALVNYHQIPFGGEELRSGSMSWQDIMQHEGEVPKVAAASLASINEVLVGLNDLFEKIRNQPTETGTAKGKEEQMDAARLAHRISETIDLAKKAVPIIETLGVITAQHWLRFAKAYQPDEIEKQMRVMAMVDARIDKVLKRLVQVKAFKDIAAAQDSNLRRVEGPAVAPT